MIKIEIPLEDIVEGEKFKSQLIRAFNAENLELKERQAGLHSDDMPRIESIPVDRTGLRFAMIHAGETYEASIPETDPNVVRAGLSFMFGMGFARYDYDSPLFNTGINEDLRDLYIKLGREIWERNIHLDWMRHVGFYTHNGTKDNLFLQGIIKPGPAKQEAIKVHNERSARGEKQDTPHHIFNNPKLLRLVLESEGEDERSKYLIESIYDQASVTSRIWHKQQDIPFEERLYTNRDKGYFIRPREDGEAERWIPGVFNLDTPYVHEIWQIWLQAHEEFKEYWIEKFGSNEELWQPPAPEDKLG